MHLNHSFLGIVIFKVVEVIIIPGNTAEVYNRYTVSIPFLNELISHQKCADDWKDPVNEWL